MDAITFPEKAVVFAANMLHKTVKMMLNRRTTCTLGWYLALSCSRDKMR